LPIDFKAAPKTSRMSSSIRMRPLFLASKIACQLSSVPSFALL
jgi:hypothetical protein